MFLTRRAMPVAVAGPLVALTVVLSGPLGAGPAPGAPVPAIGKAHPVLDPSFGQGKGWVTTPGPSGSFYGNAVAVQPDGKIVVAGQAFDDAGNSQIVVIRYCSGGSLDPDFGSGGFFTTTFPTDQGPFKATSIAIQSRTGKIVVGGGWGQGSLLVMRLRRDGRLDRTFGTGHAGVTATPVGGFATSLTLTPSGMIYLGGMDSNTPGQPLVVARYRAGGRLDQRFGDGGVKRLLFWDPTAAAGAGVATLAVTRTGDVVGAGHIDYIGGDGHGSAGAFRLAPSGRPRKWFGTAGHTEVAFAAPGNVLASWFPCAGMLGADDRLTVVGDGNADPAGAVMTIRLNRRGRLDRTFGRARDGRSIVGGASDGSAPNCGAAPARNGRISIGVENVLVQLTARGEPDRGLAPGGVVTLESPTGAQVTAVAGYGRRRLVAAGYAGTATGLGYVARAFSSRG